MMSRLESTIYLRIQMAFQADENGEIIGLTSGAGYHGAFVKIPWYESNRIQLYLLAFYLLVFAAAVIVSIYKFIKRQTDPFNMAAMISLLFVIGIFGAVYGLFIKRIDGFPAFAFGVSFFAKMMIILLMVASILSPIVLIKLIKKWRTIRAGESIFYSIVVLAFSGVILWLHYWKLLGYHF